MRPPPPQPPIPSSLNRENDMRTRSHASLPSLSLPPPPSPSSPPPPPLLPLLICITMAMGSWFQDPFKPDPSSPKAPLPLPPTDTLRRWGETTSKRFCLIQTHRRRASNTEDLLLVPFELSGKKSPCWCIVLLPTPLCFVSLLFFSPLSALSTDRCGFFMLRMHTLESVLWGFWDTEMNINCHLHLTQQGWYFIYGSSLIPTTCHNCSRLGTSPRKKIK